MSWSKTLSPMLCTFLAINTVALVRADEPKPTISVSGSAEIRVVPDQVVITAAVESRAKEVAVACQENEKSIRSVVQFLKSAGVEDKHISTEYIAIEPIMRRPAYSGKGNAQVQQSNLPFADDGEDELELPVGYLARRQFAITITHLDKFEDIYRGLIERGINRVGGIEFRTSKLREHRDEARLKAVRAAREKAQAMSAELGATLAAIKSINESQASYGRAVIQNSLTDPFGGETAGEEFAVGQIKIIATVDIVFYLGNSELDE